MTANVTRPMVASVLLAVALFACVTGEEKQDEKRIEDHAPDEEVPAWTQFDLEVGSLVTEPSRPGIGDPVRTRATIRNLGPARSSEASLTILVDGQQAAVLDIPEIEPGAEEQLEASWVVRGAGSSRVVGSLAAGDPRRDRDSTNHVLHERLLVRGGQAPLLGLTPMFEGPVDGWVERTDAPVVCSVQNTGLEPSPETGVIVYQDGRRAQELTLPAMAVDEVQTFPLTGLEPEPGSSVLTFEFAWDAETQAAGLERWSSVLVFFPGTIQPLAGPGPGVWSSLGPRLIDNRKWTGRMTCFAFHPTDSQTLYAGGRGHLRNGPGLWKSTNGGSSWTPLTDHLPTMCVQSVEVDPDHPSHVYFGSGGLRPRGIWKSVDGGLSWHQWAPKSVLWFANEVHRLAFSRVAGTTYLYAATDRGLFRHVLADPNGLSTTAGDWQLIRTGSVIGLEVHPTSEDVVYVSTRYQGMYRSDSASTASTQSGWKKLEAGLPTSIGGQFAHLDLKRDEPQRVYACVFNPAPGYRFGLYRSDNAGDDWNELGIYKINDVPANVYNPFLRVSPTDPAYLYFGGVRLFRAVEKPAGGLDIQMLPGAEADLKALEFDPNDTTRYFSLGDQGVFEGTVSTSGDVLVPRNTDLRVTQFFDLDVSTTSPRMILGGTQDTGSLLMVEGANAPDWTQVRGGDGYYSLILPPDENGEVRLVTQHQSLPSTEVRKYVAPTGVSGLSKLNQGAADGYLGGGWITKSVDEPGRIFSRGPAVREVAGPPFGPWTSAGPSAPELQGEVQRVVVQPRTGALFAGTSAGQVWHRAGGSPPGPWELRFEHPVAGASVAGMALSAANPRVLYVLYSAGTSDERVQRIELDPETGLWSFEFIGKGFVAGLAPTVVCGDGHDPHVAYVGTAVGVFRWKAPTTGGPPWSRLGGGLPHTSVSDLLVDPVSRELLAATDARGAWGLDTRPLDAADLQPVPWNAGVGPVGYCKLVGGRLAVRVRNSGASAARCVVQVEFPGGAVGSAQPPVTQQVSLGVLAPGQEATGEVEVPAGAFDPDLEFRIEVLPLEADLDLDNNIAQGRCIG